MAAANIAPDTRQTALRMPAPSSRASTKSPLPSARLTPGSRATSRKTLWGRHSPRHLRLCARKPIRRLLSACGVLSHCSWSRCSRCPRRWTRAGICLDESADPQEAKLLGNMPISFFALHGAYGRRCGGRRADRRVQGNGRCVARRRDRGGAGRRLHHTDEGDEHGPTYSLKGTSTTRTITFSSRTGRGYRNDSGTGNVPQSFVGR